MWVGFWANRDRALGVKARAHAMAIDHGLKEAEVPNLYDAMAEDEEEAEHIAGLHRSSREIAAQMRGPRRA
jgi:hypothetical protein